MCKISFSVLYSMFSSIFLLHGKHSFGKVIKWGMIPSMQFDEIFKTNTYIYIYIKHMSTIYCTLQVNKWKSKKQTFFSFCEINATKIWYRKFYFTD